MAWTSAAFLYLKGLEAMTPLSAKVQGVNNFSAVVVGEIPEDSAKGLQQCVVWAFSPVQQFHPKSCSDLIWEHGSVGLVIGQKACKCVSGPLGGWQDGLAAGLVP